jgi:hypothetical protein
MNTISVKSEQLERQWLASISLVLADDGHHLHTKRLVCRWKEEHGIALRKTGANAVCAKMLFGKYPKIWEQDARGRKPMVREYYEGLALWPVEAPHSHRTALHERNEVLDGARVCLFGSELRRTEFVTKNVLNKPAKVVNQRDVQTMTQWIRQALRAGRLMLQVCGRDDVWINLGCVEMRVEITWRARLSLRA